MTCSFTSRALSPDLGLLVSREGKFGKIHLTRPSRTDVKIDMAHLIYTGDIVVTVIIYHGKQKGTVPHRVLLHSGFLLLGCGALGPFALKTIIST